MSSKYAVLFVQKFDFTAPDGGRINGCQIHFFDPAVRAQSRSELGLAIMNVFSNRFELEDFAAVPGYYNLDIRQRRGAKGKMQSYLFDLEFISPMGKMQSSDDQQNHEAA